MSEPGSAERARPADTWGTSPDAPPHTRPPDPQPERDLIRRLGTVEWNTAESVGFEVACEAINDVIGCYSAFIAQERARPTADQQAIAAWREERRACIRERAALDPTDHDAVARVRRTYAERVVALRPQLPR